MAQANPGEQDPSTQTGTRSHQNMGDKQQDQHGHDRPKEPKRLAEPPERETKRAPEHEPGFEAKHKKEAQQEAHKRPASERSQADDSAAKIEADEDVENEKRQKANRTRPATAKQHVKRATPKAKKPIRKHK